MASEIVDFEVENLGSIALLRPKTPQAHEFAKRIGGRETMHYGDAIVVEPRYLPPIIEGIEDDGMTVVGFCF